MTMQRCSEIEQTRLAALLSGYGLTLVWVADDTPIPGSYWGESEAGLVGQDIHVRRDTPVHSVLHEVCHVLCMDATRRAVLHTDAGGDFAEEDAVCFLQITLAAQLGLSMETICKDMDAWGYTFRLGSAQAWFTQDAEDARDWLVQHGVLTDAGVPTWQLRSG
jgi:hypothetical protein